MEEAFAEFLAKRLAKWQPDLVVPAGAPAGRFVAKYRDRLFPGTPVVYSWVDIRTLPADAITNNATFVGQSFETGPAGGGHPPARPGDEQRRGDPRGDAAGAVLVGGIPEGVRAVRGAGEVHVRRTTCRSSRSWTWCRSCRRTRSSSWRCWCATRRGSRSTRTMCCERLNAASRRRSTGCFSTRWAVASWGGGCSRTSWRAWRRRAWRRGSCAASRRPSFPPLVIPPGTPTYDWRELKRWGISESRLPPGSVVLFRQPTAWELYRWHVIGAVAVIATQAVLIFALLVQRRRRQPRRAGAQEGAGRSPAEAGTTGARRARRHARRAHRNPDARDQPAAHRDPRQLRRRTAFARRTRSPTFRRCATRSATSARSPSAPAKSIQGLRGMLKRDTPGFASVDLNQLIRTVERIVHSDAILHGVTVDLDLSPGALPGQGRQRSAPAGHAEPDAQRVRRHERPRTRRRARG